MTKRLFLALVVLLSITINGSYAQIIYIPRPRPIKELIPDLKSHLNRMTLSYKQGRINEVEDKSSVYYLLSHLEFPVITRGVTTRLRYMFDNSVIAQMGVPDMRLPIQYAITYPDRFECPAESLDFFAMKDLTFAPADPETFLCLKAAIEAINKGGLYPCAVNGANERAVQLFLEDKIRFADIGRIVYAVLSHFNFSAEYTLEDVFRADKEARAFVDAQLIR